MIFISIICISCDPENGFYLKGKVFDKNDKSTITNVKVEFICYTDNREWNFEKNIAETDKSGIFYDTIISLRRFDSVKIRINERGYLTKEIMTKRNKWKINQGFMKTGFDIDFGNIELIKK